MSVGAINSSSALPLSVAIQGVLKGPVPISRTRYVDAARQAQTFDPTRPQTNAERAGAVEPAQRPDNAQPTRPAPGRAAEPARSGTAHQSNADGDSVTLSSKLDQLTSEEQEQVAKLKARDTEVRTHEQAHVAAAGGLVRGGISYTFETGPDGTRYAVGGHVSIDTSPGRTPTETIAKAQQIRAAALAPAEPSGADRAAAAKASRMESEARAELRKTESGDAADDQTLNATLPAEYDGAGAPKPDTNRPAGSGLDLVA